MRILHTSDTHGMPAPITHKCVDVIVHSGDLLPDPPLEDGHRHENIQRWQREWVQANIEGFKSWTFGRPLLFCGGNHDHADGAWLEVELRANSIDATCLDDKLGSFIGLNWFGLPYVEYINGWHAYELNDDEMKAKIDAMVDTIDASTGIDVLVAHQPPMKILDKDLRNGLHWGNRRLNDALWDGVVCEGIEAGKVPEIVLMGHCHSARGVRMLTKNYRTILFSNAATTQCLIETGA